MIKIHHKITSGFILTFYPARCFPYEIRYYVNINTGFPIKFKDDTDIFLT